ncbi:YdbH domain-containing protein [Methylomonas sp. SURF-2]|uniref:YdbH domain-containing protein n=1 Tax=Methylomonas subterranea TaxID=2952225 RepID=A0ABT1TGT6_9GAMM|nr:YdbH domain-containing protein [Methylomonas sp. SURF-2]MCQ8104461.1 YdbH domain-containing protein [Methylomonas sp. SURF-2]
MIVVAAAAIWSRHEAVLQWAIVQGLQQIPLLNPEISGARVDFRQAELARLQFGLRAGNGAITADLEGIKADYDLRAGRLGVIEMTKAKLRISYQAVDQATGTRQANDPVLALPFRRLNIKRLELEVDTPWGVSRFSGRLDGDAQPEKPLLIRLANAERTIKLQIDPNLTNASLTVEPTVGSGVLALNADQPGPTRLQGNLQGDLSELLRWVQMEELIPASLRETVSNAALIRAAPNLAGMQLNLSAWSNDKLANLAGRLELTRNQAYRASAELALNAAKSQLAIDGHLDMPFGELTGLIKPWLPETLGGWQASTGQVMGAVHFNWLPDGPSTGRIYLNGYSLGMLAGPIEAEDGYIRLAVEDIVKPALQLEMALPKLHVGKETILQALQLNVRLNNRILAVDRFGMPAFGGQMSIVQDTVNIDELPLKLTLEVKKLDLAQLLDSLNYPQLSGSGELDGKLPLSLTTDSIEIKDGKLHGLRPGVLRYDTPVTESENPAFSALRNLQYHKLQATLNYQADGDYRVGLRLEGKNPRVFSGHPVAFNLNLNGHLPDLLQKGLLAGDFDKPILEQIKAGQP